jgi:hypothetical protein
LRKFNFFCRLEGVVLFHVEQRARIYVWADAVVMSFGRLLEDSKAGESMLCRRANVAPSDSSKVPRGTANPPKNRGRAFHVKHAIEIRNFICRPRQTFHVERPGGAGARNLVSRVPRGTPVCQAGHIDDRCLQCSRIYGNGDSVAWRPHRAFHVERPWTGKNLASCSTWNANVARRQVSRVGWLLSEIFEVSEGPAARSLGGPTARSTWNCLSQNLRGASALRDASFA